MKSHSAPRPRTVTPDAEYLRHALSVTAKEAIWLMTARHRQGAKKNICLFATRRGGSTWIMELIATQPGVRSLNEPFGSWFGVGAQVLRMPKYAAGHPVHFESPEEEERFRAFTELLLSGRAPVNAPWSFWRKGYRFRSDRLVLKILEAKALIDWFDRTFDVQIVYVTRHPIPQALSCIRNGWAPSSRAYLGDPWFREEQLGDELADYAFEVVRTGSALERYVLNWALENYVPLKLIHDRPAWIYASYEECVVRQEATLERLAEALELTDVDAMRGAFSRPSSTSRMSQAQTLEQIQRGDAGAALRAWRHRISEEEERGALEILARLRIPLYEVGSDLPRPWW
jgi:hypothetical protein